jgi:type II secretory pathway pseudopilin PulG
MTTPKKLHKQKGNLMIELAIVVAIIALLAAAMWPTMTRVFSGIRAGKVVNELNLAIPSIQTAYQNRNSYSGITTAQVATNRWFNDNFLEMNAGVPTGVIVTQWGTITFVAAASGTQVQGTLNNIPTRECVKIAESFNNDLYLTANINGSAVKTATTVLDATSVGSQCATSSTNTLTFTFGRA